MRKKVIKKSKMGKGEIRLLDDGTYSYIDFIYDNDENHILKSTMKTVMEMYFDSIQYTDEREDAVQFCYKHDDQFWVYFEYVYKDKYMHEMNINLRTYSNEEKNEAIKGFYGSMDEVIETYGDGSDQIIAECIFENSIY